MTSSHGLHAYRSKSHFRDGSHSRRPQAVQVPGRIAAMHSVAGLLCAHIAFGCTGSGDSSHVRPASKASVPNHIFDVVRFITLTENVTTINVHPIVTLDNMRDHFVIADGREDKVRLYDPVGNLILQFGRTGEGPGEFGSGSPIEAVRETSGHIAAVDFGGKIIQFDSTGRFVHSSRLPITPLYNQRLLRDGRRLVAGIIRGSDPSTPRDLLHVVENDAIEYSFFLSPGDSVTQVNSLHFGQVSFGIRGDTIAAVSALTDTLYVFTAAGVTLETVAIPFRGFRRMSAGDESAESLEAITQLLDQSHLISDLYWLSDGSVVFQYERPRGPDSDWNVMRMTRNGEFVFDIANTPRLLTVDNDDMFYFLDPQSMTPDKWIVARLR